MIVERLWVGNRLRNYNYLVACPDTGDALAIDPLDVRQCMAVASEKGYSITQIVNTHHHHDHIGGNTKLIAKTGATLIAHADAVDKIPNVDRPVTAGDTVKVGTSTVLDCLDTPGHTMSHVCLLSRTSPPVLFAGDTLFNAGAGNCHNGGHPEALYTTFVEQLAKLPGDTRIYPGHDYLLNNLAFTLDREPDNAAARRMRDAFADTDPTDAPVTTLAEERQINSFLRLDSPTLVERLAAQYDTATDPKSVFLKLRELRNSW